jgi:predicted Zn-dependent peptidase
VREFFRQYYTPNNATLAIVGDFDKAKIKALVEIFLPNSSRARGAENYGDNSAD